VNGVPLALGAAGALVIGSALVRGSAARPERKLHLSLSDDLWPRPVAHPGALRTDREHQDIVDGARLLRQLVPAFGGQHSPVEVISTPDFMSTRGRVAISKGRADVDFVGVADTIEEIIENDQLSPADAPALRRWYEVCAAGFDGDAPLLARVTRTIEARDFAEVNRRIMAAETDLFALWVENNRALARLILWLKMPRMGGVRTLPPELGG
jgi:hypothetical protein